MEKEIDKIDKGCLKTFLAKGIWAQQRLRQHGLADNEKCRLCGGADTLYHRIRGGCHESVPLLSNELDRDWLNQEGLSEEGIQARWAGHRETIDIPLPMTDGWECWSEMANKTL